MDPNKFIAHFDPDGVIVSTVHAPVSQAYLDMCEQANMPFILVDGPAAPEGFFTNYCVDVSAGALLPRPAFNLPETVEINADSSDSFVASGLPDPCKIQIDDEPVVVEGGELTLTADMPAEFDILFIQPPFVHHRMKVIARAPDAQ